MGRKNRRVTYEPRVLGGNPAQREEHSDGDWFVRKLTGSSATKVYRCPGCDQEIRPATPHVVAWPADYANGAEDRRHWHTPCWTKREHRRPRRT